MCFLRLRTLLFILLYRNDTKKVKLMTLTVEYVLAFSLYSSGKGRWKKGGKEVLDFQITWVIRGFPLKAFLSWGREGVGFTNSFSLCCHLPHPLKKIKSLPIAPYIHPFPEFSLTLQERKKNWRRKNMTFIQLLLYNILWLFVYIFVLLGERNGLGI